jgi:hypothetical protein
MNYGCAMCGKLDLAPSGGIDAQVHDDVGDFQSGFPGFVRGLELVVMMSVALLELSSGDIVS